MISRDTAAPRMMMLPVLYHGSYPSDLSFSETVVTFRSAGVFRHIPLDGVFAPPGESSSTAAAFYYDSRVITWSTWQTFLPLFVIPLSIVIRPSSPLIKTQFLIRPRGGHGIERRENLPRPFVAFRFYHFHEWERGGSERGGGGGEVPAAGRSISGGARYTEYWFSCGYNRYTRVTRASVTLSAAICRPSFRRSEPTPRGNRIGSEAYREESKERREGKRRRKSEERRGIYIYIYIERKRETRSPRLSAEA